MSFIAKEKKFYGLGSFSAFCHHLSFVSFNLDSFSVCLITLIFEKYRAVILQNVPILEFV